tara:strand:+ start:2821 stop:3459 length:639 start_codon:yes stop_codon:yes gene_type:complete
MSDFNKPYNRMSDEEKREYSKFIQTKYINDFDGYLRVLNKGRISLHKRQIIEWVEALRMFSPEVIDSGWKKFIQLLRPNFVPSIKDAIDHFKTTPTPIRTVRREEPEEKVSDEQKTDLHKLMNLCMKYSEVGPIAFHNQCIDFYETMAEKEQDINNKSSFKQAVREHRKMLKEAENIPEYKSIAKKNREKVIDTIEEVFETDPIHRGNKSPI